jgi:hypothetical protein
MGGNIRVSVLVNGEHLQGYRRAYNRIFLEVLTSKQAEHDRLVEELNLYRDDLISSRSLLGAALSTVNANYWALREWVAKFLESEYQYTAGRDVHRSDEWTYAFEPMETALLRSFKDPNEPNQSPQ